MIKNKYGLKIEVNMSSKTKHIGNAYASEEELEKLSKAFFSPHILIPIV